MSRTNRTYWSDGNWREARKGGARYRAERDAIWDANLPGQRTPTGSWKPRGPRHGGMLMSSSNTGFWSDECRHVRMKRAVKRGERQRALVEAWSEALDTAEAPEPFYVDDYTRGSEDFIVDDFTPGLYDDPLDWPY